MHKDPTFVFVTVPDRHVEAFDQLVVTATRPAISPWSKSTTKKVLVTNCNQKAENETR